jgi:hypothetical protein
MHAKRALERSLNRGRRKNHGVKGGEEAGRMMFLFSPSLRIIEGLSIRVLTYAAIADYLGNAEESDDQLGYPGETTHFYALIYWPGRLSAFQPPSVAIE